MNAASSLASAASAPGISSSTMTSFTAAIALPWRSSEPSACSIKFSNTLLTSSLTSIVPPFSSIASAASSGPASSRAYSSAAASDMAKSRGGVLLPCGLASVACGSRGVWICSKPSSRELAANTDRYSRESRALSGAVSHPSAVLPLLSSNRTWAPPAFPSAAGCFAEGGGCISAGGGGGRPPLTAFCLAPAAFSSISDLFI